MAHIETCSKVELMAQKQNRVAQTLLNDKIEEINRQKAVWRLTFSMEQRSIKYEIALVKRSTGHSKEARPPTGRMDTRAPITLDSKKRTRLPRIKRSGSPTGIPGQAQSGETDENGQLLERSILGPPDNESQSADTTLPPIDQTDPSLHDRTGRMSPLREVTELSSSSDQESSTPIFLTDDHAGVEDDNEETHNKEMDGAVLKARLDESKRIMNMPSIYQTQNLVNKQDFKLRTRVLPPIYRREPQSDEEADDNEKSENKENNEGGKTSVQTETTDSKRKNVSLLPVKKSKEKRKPKPKPKPKPRKLKRQKSVQVSLIDDQRWDDLVKCLEGDKKRIDISMILQASLEKAAQQKAEERRKQQRDRSRRKLLTTDNAGGIYRPENVKLIKKSFRKEDLYNQHKQLLANNTTSKQIPIDKLVGSQKTETKVKNFMSSSF